MKLLRNKVVQNGIWLYLLLFVNTVLPMATIPYVTRELGPENYGYYNIALNWIMYLHAIVTYGFDMVGSRHVALAKDDKPALQRYVSSVVYAKLILTVISALAMGVLIAVSDYSATQSICIAILFVSVIGEAFKQTWLFQGLQEMQNITIISAIARIVTTVLVFLFVHEDSLFFYCWLYAASGLFVGVAGLVISRWRLGIRMVAVPLREIWQRLVDGFVLFTTSAMSKIFTGFGVTFLGTIVSVATVGIYSAIYKIPSILISCFSPISQVIYPHICGLYSQDYKKGKSFALRVGAVVTALFIAGSCVVVFLREFVVTLAFGSEYAGYCDLLVPFMCWLCTSIANSFLGTQILIASGRSKEYSRAFIAGIVSLLGFTVAFGSGYGIYGVAWAQFFSELVLLISNAVAIILSERKQTKI